MVIFRENAAAWRQQLLGRRKPMKLMMVAILFGGLLLGGGPRERAPKAIWTSDLSSQNVYQEASELRRSLPESFGHAFLDDRTIAVSLDFQFGGDLSRRHNNPIVIVDAANGTIAKSHTWKWEGRLSSFDNAVLFPVGDSACLVVIGDELLRLSPRLEIAAKRKLPLDLVPHRGLLFTGHWTILTDPGAKKAVLGLSPFVPDDTAEKYSEAHWISVETLQDESTARMHAWPFAEAALAGNAVIFIPLSPAGQPIRPRPTMIQGPTGPPRPLCGDCFGGPRKSFGKGLIFFRTREAFFVTDMAGKIVYQGEKLGGRGDTIGAVSGAVTTNRVAVTFGHLGRRLEETVVVLDVDTKKELTRFDLHVSPVVSTLGRFVKEDFRGPRLALSPDGKKLAILTGTILSLYEIP